MLWKKVTITFICLFLATFAVEAKAETPEEWVKLGRRVHGGFGSFVAVGIRIGLDAKERLDAEPRELEVTYQDGPFSPCPCVADGIMIATVSTPGQNSLQVLPDVSFPNVFGVAVITNPKTGKSLRYVLPESARLLLESWNRELDEQGRYYAVMEAPASSLYRVEEIEKPTESEAPETSAVQSQGEIQELGESEVPKTKAAQSGEKRRQPILMPRRLRFRQ